jgi:hypothetical protein
LVGSSGGNHRTDDTGKTRDDALDNLDEVIDAVENDTGRPPTDEELRAAGIDPEDNRRAGSGDLPDVLN